MLAAGGAFADSVKRRPAASCPSHLGLHSIQSLDYLWHLGWHFLVGWRHATRICVECAAERGAARAPPGKGGHQRGMAVLGKRAPYTPALNGTAPGLGLRRGAARRA